MVDLEFHKSRAAWKDVTQHVQPPGAYYWCHDSVAE